MDRYSTCGPRRKDTPGQKKPRCKLMSGAELSELAKLDELLRVTQSADSELAKIDALEPEKIKRLRDEG